MFWPAGGVWPCPSLLTGWLQVSHEGVSFQGSDLRFESMDDPDTCQRTCTIDPLCQFYTYFNESYSNPEFRYSVHSCQQNHEPGIQFTQRNHLAFNLIFNRKDHAPTICDWKVQMKIDDLDVEEIMNGHWCENRRWRGEERGDEGMREGRWREEKKTERERLIK